MEACEAWLILLGKVFNGTTYRRFGTSYWIWFDFDFFFFSLSCHRDEEKLDKYLDPTVLPESLGKMMEILNNSVLVDALWQSIYASSSKIPKTTGMTLWKEILSSSCSCDKVSVQHSYCGGLHFLLMRVCWRWSCKSYIRERCTVTGEALHWYISVRYSQLKCSQKICQAGWIVY